MEGGARAVTLALTRPLQRVWNASVGTFQRHPFLVKTLSSGVGFAFGDALTQAATRREDDPYDWRRTAAMAGAGLAVAGPVGYGFIIWMEGHVMTAAPARWVWVRGARCLGSSIRLHPSRASAAACSPPRPAPPRPAPPRPAPPRPAPPRPAAAASPSPPR